MSAESAHRIAEALSSRHGRGLSASDGERFEVTARMEGETIIARVVLGRPDRTFRYEMECARTLEEGAFTLNASDTLDLCLDFLDWYLGEYFREGRELLLPLDWQPHRFGEFEVLARGDVRNPLLEDAADAWLRGEKVAVPEDSRRRRS